MSECVLKKSEVPVEPYIIMETAQLNQEGAAAEQAAEGPADKAAGGGGGGADGASKKVAVAGQWSIVGKPASVHAFKSKGSLESERVAAFDLDSTLVTTKSGVQAEWQKGHRRGVMVGSVCPCRQGLPVVALGLEVVEPPGARQAEGAAQPGLQGAADPDPSPTRSDIWLTGPVEYVCRW